MDRELATRIAATVGDGVTLEQAQMVIAEFLTRLAQCPVCDGSGTTTFGRDVEVELHDPNHLSSNGHQTIRAGTVGSCPRCGSRDADLSGKGDPTYVGWLCTRGDSVRDCRHAHGGKDSVARNEHVACGWRIALPYEPAP